MRNLYFSSKSLYKITGHIPPPWETPHKINGKPVYFVHVPKSAGSSLKMMLGCKSGKTTHAMPRLVMRKQTWHHSFIITAVRHPFDRFLSSYSYVIKNAGSGVLNRMYGPALQQLDPFEYLDFIQQFPEKLGLQIYWTQYPSVKKPAADLILRVEESAKWIEQLNSTGITAVPDKIERRNASRNGKERIEETLSLDAPQVAQLETQVQKVFARDYAAFGY